VFSFSMPITSWGRRESLAAPSEVGTKESNGDISPPFSRVWPALREGIAQGVSGNRAAGISGRGAIVGPARGVGIGKASQQDVVELLASSGGNGHSGDHQIAGQQRRILDAGGATHHLVDAVLVSVEVMAGGVAGGGVVEAAGEGNDLAGDRV